MSELPCFVPCQVPISPGSGSSIHLSHIILILSVSQKWNGEYFEETTLTALGLVIQLGHGVGGMCTHPSCLHDLMVFNLSGVHHLIVHYCACGNMGESIPKDTQVLRARWFPTTIEQPSTAFSFDLLGYFHRLQNCNKCNPYDFYHTIIQQTNAARLDPEIVSFFTIFDVLSLTHFSIASLQQDHISFLHLVPPPTPQTRRCRLFP